MFCSQCGNQCPDDAQFCVKCGRKIGETIVASNTAIASSIPSNATNESNALAKTLQYFGLSALVLGVGVMIYYLCFFSITVTTEPITVLGQSLGGDSVNNIGLISDRQDGMIVGISTGFLGLILFAVGLLLQARRGKIDQSGLIVYGILLSAATLAGVYGVSFQKQHQADNEKQKLSSTRLKMIGLGIVQFSIDQNEKLPTMDDVSEVQTAIQPYVSDPSTFVDPITSSPYATNKLCSGISMINISDPSALVEVYADKPDAIGCRWVLFQDGHTKKINADLWAKILANKGNKPAKGGDINWDAQDTMVPS